MGKCSQKADLVGGAIVEVGGVRNCSNTLRSYVSTNP